MQAPKAKKVLIVVPTNGDDGRRRLTGIMRFIAERTDWNILLFNNVGYQDAEKLLVLRNAELSGVILAHDTADKLFARILPPEVPIVLLNSDFLVSMSKGHANVSAVLSDCGEIGRCAMAYFRKLGRFASFGFVHNRTRARWSVDREKAFSSALPKDAAYSTFSGDGAAEIDEKQIAAWLAPMRKPIAILAANDFVGTRVIAACKTARLNVPKSVCVLGCDNDLFLCSSSRPHLSSIEQPAENAGWQAAQLLDKMMSRRRKAPSTIIVRGAFVVTRDSTAFILPATQLVARADEYIRQHACDGVNASDVIAAMHVSRSLLNLRFRQLRGKSIQQAILDCRLERLCELLSTTRQDIAAIGKAVGFKSPAHLKRLFLRRYGMTMSLWRKTHTTSQHAH